MTCCFGSVVVVDVVLAFRKSFHNEEITFCVKENIHSANRPKMPIIQKMAAIGYKTIAKAAVKITAKTYESATTIFSPPNFL